MKPSTRSRIELIFARRYREAHNFHRNSEGLKEFADLLPLVHKLSCKEVREFFLPLLDNLLFFNEHCQNCHAKLLIFAEIYCIDTCASKSVVYLKRFEELMKDRKRSHATKRDYRLEVYEALGQQG
jgi:hypothetical protein